MSNLQRRGRSDRDEGSERIRDASVWTRFVRAPGWIGWWSAAIVLFGFSDVVITSIAISFELAAEQNPIGILVLSIAGIPGLVVWKAGTISLLYAVSVPFGNPERYGVPIGLSTLGTVVVTWNLWVVL